MTPNSLLNLYNRVADAPDAISRLRRFVLDLAVRGKLVEQDQTDEAASELLKRIAAEKARLKIKNRSTPLTSSDIPFPLPKGWSWSRIGELCSKTGSGSTPRGGKEAYKLSGIPFLRSQNVYDDGMRLADVACIAPEVHERMAGTKVVAADLLLNITGGSIGRCCRVPDDFSEANISQHVAIVRPAVEGMSGFLHKLILSPYFQAFIFNEQTGAGRGGLPKNRMDRIAVAVPPLTEQRRIVSKVNELMGLLDRLEASRASREAARDRLSRASLARLTAPDTSAEEFPNHARFALNELSALTTRPDQIKPLRQTILNLAVRGKLVEQDPADEPATNLVEMIRSERKAAIKRSVEPDMALVDFSIPSHWVWQSLDAILTDGPQNGLSPRKSERTDAPKAITLTATTSGTFDARQFKHVDVSMEDAAGYWLEPGDLLFQRGNTREYVGMTAVYDGPTEEFLFPDLIMRVKTSLRMDIRFVHLWCIAPYARRFLSENATGAQQTMPKINQRILRSLPIPLPPLAEQHRIVAKVDALMALCDRLEAALTTTDTTRARLLEALLHEALAPTAEAVTEAAE